MPVLYGVFLYMGASSLRGIQFFDRLKLFGMPAKHQPDFIYLRHVPLRKVHLFTIIQLSCLVLLWVIKTSNYAIVFPMMVMCLEGGVVFGWVGWACWCVCVRARERD